MSKYLYEFFLKEHDSVESIENDFIDLSRDLILEDDAAPDFTVGNSKPKETTPAPASDAGGGPDFTIGASKKEPEEKLDVSTSGGDVKGGPDFSIGGGDTPSGDSGGDMDFSIGDEEEKKKEKKKEDQKTKFIGNLKELVKLKKIIDKIAIKISDENIIKIKFFCIQLLKTITDIGPEILEREDLKKINDDVEDFLKSAVLRLSLIIDKYMKDLEEEGMKKQEDVDEDDEEETEDDEEKDVEKDENEDNNKKEINKKSNETDEDDSDKDIDIDKQKEDLEDIKKELGFTDEDEQDIEELMKELELSIGEE